MFCWSMLHWSKTANIPWISIYNIWNTNKYNINDNMFTGPVSIHVNTQWAFGYLHQPRRTRGLGSRAGSLLAWAAGLGLQCGRDARGESGGCAQLDAEADHGKTMGKTEINVYEVINMANVRLFCLGNFAIFDFAKAAWLQQPGKN